MSPALIIIKIIINKKTAVEKKKMKTLMRALIVRKSKGEKKNRLNEDRGCILMKMRRGRGEER